MSNMPRELFNDIQRTRTNRHRSAASGPCKPGFLLPAPVLSRLFRRLFLAQLADAHAEGQLSLFGEIEGLRRRKAFAAHLAH
jgi:hypothetical protein